jgi:hypothetical protein
MIISLLYSSIIFKDRAMTIEEPYENISVNVGNELCSYFYKLGKCILEKKTFNIEPSKYKGVAFFEHLPTSLPYTYDSIYNDLSTYDITNDNFSDKIGDCEVCAWEIVNNHRHYFWKCLKPLIHTIMNDAFEKSELVKNVPYPIIHFRCADTPFIKQNGYNLQRYAFFKEALEKIQAEQFMDVNSIYLMSCSTHMSNKEQQQSCVKYSESLSDYLNSIGYKCKTICNSNIDDFAMLFYAPAVISTSSSYSFMGGFFSNGIFMSSENSNGKCDSCSDWMLYGFNLQHEHVDNYVDYNSVIPLLKV